MKKLYLSLSDLAYGGAAWRRAANRIGATITNIMADGAVPIPLTDQSTRELAKAGLLPQEWMPVLDRMKLQEMGIPTIPVVAPMSASDEIPFDGPVFVKPRHTNLGAKHYAYTQYESVAAFRSSVGQDFWDYQKSASATADEYVVSPAIPAPFDCVETCIAVNGAGQLKVAFSNLVTHDTSKLLGSGAPFDFPPECLALTDQVCTSLGIRNALISIQFAPYGGQWVVMDWHLRPPAVFSEGLVTDHPGACDSCLAHALDGQVEDVPFYWEHRAYWSSGIPQSLRPLAVKLGLIPRVTQGGVFGRVVGAGPSKEDVQERLKQFEEQLCLSVLLQP